MQQITVPIIANRGSCKVTVNNGNVTAGNMGKYFAKPSILNNR